MSSDPRQPPVHLALNVMRRDLPIEYLNRCRLFGPALPTFRPIPGPHGAESPYSELMANTYTAAVPGGSTGFRYGAGSISERSEHGPEEIPEPSVYTGTSVDAGRERHHGVERLPGWRNKRHMMCGASFELVVVWHT